ncbi:ATP-binding protein [Acidiphilium sp.]|uniref:ATP-binding protein n=1 Tax=Acidiphilium sp. TaxID=527 RepID=UPI003D085447
MILLNVMPKSDAERRQITVLFCDLVGSTTLSTTLDPEDMRELLNAFFSTCSQEVARFGGTIGKYLGDGVLAYFGYPHAHEDDAERAARAARAMTEEIGRLGSPNGGALRVRCGIATGVVLAGDTIGDPAMNEPAVVGETLNLAARLQTLAPPGGIVIAEQTRRLLGRAFRLEAGEPARLPGFAGTTPYWLVTGETGTATRFEARRGTAARMIGRDGEFERLRVQAAAALTGAGGAVLLRGDPGIGKSRLAASLADALRGTATPPLIITYQCTPFHRESVLYPFRTQFMRAYALTEADPAEARLAALEAMVARLQPDDPDAMALFAALFAIPTGARFALPVISPTEQRRRTLAAIMQAMRHLARERPLFLLFEDAHWADPTSMTLLGMIVASLRATAGFVMVTARPGIEPDWVAVNHVATLDLDHLDSSSTTELVRAVASGRTLDAVIEREIVDRADGVPLFAEELTRAVLEADVTTIPATLQDSLMARLDRLGDAKDIAQMAAAIGRDFSVALLERIAGRDRPMIDVALERLEATGLVIATPAAPGAYRFKHALVRDTAYESLPRTRRRTLHLALAETLRDQFTEEAEAEPQMVARHFALARQAASSAAWWLKAGELAMRRAAFLEATEHFAEAIKLVEPLDESPEVQGLRLRLQLAHGQALMTVRGYNDPGAGAAFQRAFAIAARLPAAELRHIALHGMWIAAWITANLAAMHGLNAALTADTSATPGTPGALMALNQRGMMHWLRAEFTEAAALFEACIAAVPEDPDPIVAVKFNIDPGVNALTFLGLTLWPLGRCDAAVACFDAALARAERCGHAPGIAYVRLFRCQIDLDLGALDAAQRNAATVLRMAETGGLEFFRAWAQSLDGYSRVRAGEAAGLTQLAAARQFSEETGARVGRAYFGSLHASALALYAPAEALALNRADEAIMIAVNQSWATVDLYLTRGFIFLRHEPPDVAGAEAAYRHAHAIAITQAAPTSRLRAAVALAGLLHQNGRDDEVSTLLTDALNEMPSGGEILPHYAQARTLLALLSSAQPEAGSDGSGAPKPMVKSN